MKRWMLGLFCGFIVGAVFLASAGEARADCTCRTVSLGGGKNCVLTDSSGCGPAEVAKCQTNSDGACNHNIFDGGSCVCVTGEEGEEERGGSDVGMDAFCGSRGHGAASADPWVNTALGCVPVRTEAFMVWLLPKLFGIAGGVAFLLMVAGFIQMASSKGDPKKVAEAKERITSAVGGLVVCVLAIFLLRLIAVDILHIPGLEK